MMKRLYAWLRWMSSAGACFALVFLALPAQAGNLWLTGHDADFHCSGGNQCNHMGVAANFVRQGAPTKTLPILVLDSGTQVATALSNPTARARNAVEGAGNPFPITVVDPSTPAFATTPLTVANWSAIIIASDSSCGGCDNDVADIAAINARTAEIQAFFNAGGGLFYLSGAANRATYYASVPIPATGAAVSPPFTLTTVGTSLGLIAPDDTNCCATHNSFSLPPPGSPLQVAELDSAGLAETLVATGASVCSGVLCGGPTAGPPIIVPTLGDTAMILLATLLALAGLSRFRGRRR
jgi:IPTL-CTERM motif